MKTRKQTANEIANTTENINTAPQSSSATIQDRLSSLKAAATTQLQSTMQAAKEIDRKKATEMVSNAAKYSAETAKSVTEKSGLLNQNAEGWQMARSASAFLALSAAYDVLFGSTLRAYVDAIAAGAFGLAAANQAGMLESVKPIPGQAYQKAMSLFASNSTAPVVAAEQEVQNPAPAAPGM